MTVKRTLRLAGLVGVRYCTDKFCENESELFQRSNNVDPMKPRIGLLLGDPTGIGPELVAKLLAFPETLAQGEVLVIVWVMVVLRGCRWWCRRARVWQRPTGAQCRNRRLPRRA